MTYALYRVIDNTFLEDIKAIQKAFAKGNTEFIRWDFEKDNDLVPEIFSGQYGSLLKLKVNNDRVTPFAETEEITAMFSILLQEEPNFILSTSSDDRTHFTELEFAAMN